MKGLSTVTESLDDEAADHEPSSAPQPSTLNPQRSPRKKPLPTIPTLTTGASLLAGTTVTVNIPIGFQPGMHVRHPRYGLGQVLTIGHIASRRTVTVAFDEDGRIETFVASKCPLQPVGV